MGISLSLFRKITSIIDRFLYVSVVKSPWCFRMWMCDKNTEIWFSKGRVLEEASYFFTQGLYFIVNKNDIIDSSCEWVEEKLMDIMPHTSFANILVVQKCLWILIIVIHSEGIIWRTQSQTF